MFLSWKITDDISNITVEEFNKEYNGLDVYKRQQLQLELKQNLLAIP